MNSEADHSHDESPLLDVIERVANYGGGPEVTYRVPESAMVRLDDRRDGSHLLAGATFASWPTHQLGEIDR